jgi:hypothetical protein
MAESDLASDGKSHSVSRSLSAESCPESDPLAIGRKWYSLDADAAAVMDPEIVARVADFVCEAQA